MTLKRPTRFFSEFAEYPDGLMLDTLTSRSSVAFLTMSVRADGKG